MGDRVDAVERFDDVLRFLEQPSELAVHEFLLIVIVARLAFGLFLAAALTGAIGGLGRRQIGVVDEHVEFLVDDFQLGNTFRGGAFRFGTVLEAKALSIDASLLAPELEPPESEAESLDALLPTLAARQLTLEADWRFNGRHYQRTLEAWRQQHEQHRADQPHRIKYRRFERT